MLTRPRAARRTLLLPLALCALGCTRSYAQNRAAPAPPAAARNANGLPTLPARPAARASDAFNQFWGDGRAELSGYRATVSRYGELRSAEVALVYVTEPLDRRTWIKDDDAPEPERVNVLKLNASIKFLTGVYPYSILTSVFAPVDQWRPGAERFSPVKLTMSAQEWCGHVFQGVWPGEREYVSQIFSYFASEGERRDTAPAEPGTLYEDALLIQLRELDGPFARGGNWSGMLLPSLWGIRRAHVPTRAVRATITRSRAALDGQPVNRFVLAYGDYTRTFDVEVAPPRRVLAWRGSDGEDVRLIRTARLPYWMLNHNGDEARRADFGLAVPGGAGAGGPPPAQPVAPRGGPTVAPPPPPPLRR